MSKLLILNKKGSKEKYSILVLQNIEHFEKHMGKPDLSQEISDFNASVQNIGVCSVYASQAIKNTKARYVFLEICEQSIGKFKTSTDRINQKYISEKLGISRKTLIKYIKELENDRFLKVEKSNHKKIGTGSNSNKYTPIFKQ